MLDYGRHKLLDNKQSKINLLWSFKIPLIYKFSFILYFRIEGNLSAGMLTIKKATAKY